MHMGNFTNSLLTSTFLTLTLMLGAAWPALSADQVTGNNLKQYPGSIISRPKPAGPARATEFQKAALQNVDVTLSFTFVPANRDDANKLGVQDSENVDLVQKYLDTQAPDPDAIKRLSDFLKKNNWTVFKSQPGTPTFFARAPASVVAKTLKYEVKNFVSADGKLVPSAISPALLPPEIGKDISAIVGTQPDLGLTTEIISPSSVPTSGVEVSKTVAKRPAQPFKVADILRAYDGEGLTVTGKGQIIAILIDTFPRKEDLEKFWRDNHVKNKFSKIELIDVQGLGNNLSAPSGEETLDAEWASSIAPGAVLRIYASGSLKYVALNLALNRILSDVLHHNGPNVLSVSLGLREDLVPRDVITSQGRIFSGLSMLGVTTFVASGDAGSNPDETGHGRGEVTNVEYEASDPNVIAVGGTSLTVDPTLHTRKQEIAWPDSGGGVSLVSKNQLWQKPYPGIPQGGRLVPDVSADADPNPGAYVILNDAAVPYGGTSWSAPIWAGIAALIGEELSKTGRSIGGSIAPKLYHMAGDPALREIVEGSNGAYKAGPGWNPVTGLGAPDIRLLIKAFDQ